MDLAVHDPVERGKPVALIRRAALFHADDGCRTVRGEDRRELERRDGGPGPWHDDGHDARVAPGVHRAEHAKPCADDGAGPWSPRFAGPASDREHERRVVPSARQGSERADVAQGGDLVRDQRGDT